MRATFYFTFSAGLVFVARCKKQENESFPGDSQGNAPKAANSLVIRSQKPTARP